MVGFPVDFQKREQVYREVDGWENSRSALFIKKDNWWTRQIARANIDLRPKNMTKDVKTRLDNLNVNSRTRFISADDNRWLVNLPDIQTSQDYLPEIVVLTQGLSFSRERFDLVENVKPEDSGAEEFMIRPLH